MTSASPLSLSSTRHLRALLPLLLLLVSFSLLLCLTSAQTGSSSSSASSLPGSSSSGVTVGATSATSAPSASATTSTAGSAGVGSFSSSSSSNFSASSSGPSVPVFNASLCVNSTGLTTNTSTGTTTTFTSVCPECALVYRNVSVNGSFVLNATVVCGNSTLYCTSTYSNATFTTSTACTNVTATIVVPVVAPTSLEILINATCPTVNPVELYLFENYNATGECAGGEVDGQFTCDPSTPQCANRANQNNAQGAAQDSLYSTNPPYWWRCTYTYPSTPNNSACVTTVNNATGNITVTCPPAIPGAVVSNLQVVDPDCFSDSSLCAPRRYITQINRLRLEGGTQWLGQSMPPYSQFQNLPVAIVTAGAATVNASIFYPELDVLQLLQVIDSYNTAFLSLSASTRIVVETIGGVISNSRTRINSACQYVVPFFTLIIDLDEGYIDSATWQDDCSTCTAASFVYSDDGACNCGVPITSCIGYNASTASTTTVATSSTNFTATQVSCDLQIYFAYSGTDSSGVVLTSSSRTIANFRKWSLGSVYNSAVGYYDNLPSLTSNFNTCLQVDANGNCIKTSGS